MNEHACDDRCFGGEPLPQQPCPRCGAPADIGMAYRGPYEKQSILACVACGFCTPTRGSEAKS